MITHRAFGVSDPVLVAKGLRCHPRRIDWSLRPGQ
jgi:hypothetical protein